MSINLSQEQRTRWATLPRQVRAVARRTPIKGLTLDDVIALRSEGRIGERDLAALEIVFRGGGVMMTHQIHTLAYTHLRAVRSVQRRLRKLFDLGLLERTWWEGRLPFEEEKKSLVHYLSPAGGQVAMVRLGISPSRVRRQVLVAERMLDGNRLAHDLVAVELWMLLEQFIRPLGGRVEWWGGRLVFQQVQDADNTVRAFAPDGLATLIVGDRERPLWVEVDMGTESLYRIRRKVRLAELAFRTQEWRKSFASFPPVMMVTPGRRRANNIAELVDQERRQAVIWLVCSLEEIKETGINGQIWRVPGQPDRVNLLS